MNVDEMRAILASCPGHCECAFMVNGEPVKVDAYVVIPEWSTLYLGEDNETLKEDMIQHTAEFAGLDDDVFIDALETSENLKDYDDYRMSNPDKNDEPCGAVCSIPEPTKPAYFDRTTEQM